MDVDGGAPGLCPPPRSSGMQRLASAIYPAHPVQPGQPGQPASQAPWPSPSRALSTTSTLPASLDRQHAWSAQPFPPYPVPIEPQAWHSAEPGLALSAHASSSSAYAPRSSDVGLASACGWRTSLDDPSADHHRAPTALPLTPLVDPSSISHVPGSAEQPSLLSAHQDSFPATRHLDTSRIEMIRAHQRTSHVPSPIGTSTSHPPARFGALDQGRLPPQRAQPHGPPALAAHSYSSVQQHNAPFALQQTTPVSRANRNYGSLPASIRAPPLATTTVNHIAVGQSDASRTTTSTRSHWGHTLPHSIAGLSPHVQGLNEAAQNERPPYTSEFEGFLPKSLPESFPSASALSGVATLVAPGTQSQRSSQLQAAFQQGRIPWNAPSARESALKQGEDLTPSSQTSPFRPALLPASGQPQLLQPELNVARVGSYETSNYSHACFEELPPMQPRYQQRQQAQSAYQLHVQYQELYRRQQEQLWKEMSQQQLRAQQAQLARRREFQQQEEAHQQEKYRHNQYQRRIERQYKEEIQHQEVARRQIEARRLKEREHQEESWRQEEYQQKLEAKHQGEARRKAELQRKKEAKRKEEARSKQEFERNQATRSKLEAQYRRDQKRRVKSINHEKTFRLQASPQNERTQRRNDDLAQMHHQSARQYHPFPAAAPAAKPGEATETTSASAVHEHTLDPFSELDPRPQPTSTDPSFSGDVLSSPWARLYPPISVDPSSLQYTHFGATASREKTTGFADHLNKRAINLLPEKSTQQSSARSSPGSGLCHLSHSQQRTLEPVAQGHYPSRLAAPSNSHGPTNALAGPSTPHTLLTPCELMSPNVSAETSLPQKTPLHSVSPSDHKRFEAATPVLSSSPDPLNLISPVPAPPVRKTLFPGRLFPTPAHGEQKAVSKSCTHVDASQSSSIISEDMKKKLKAQYASAKGASSFGITSARTCLDLQPDSSALVSSAPVRPTTHSSDLGTTEPNRKRKSSEDPIFCHSNLDRTSGGQPKLLRDPNKLAKAKVQHGSSIYLRRQQPPQPDQQRHLYPPHSSTKSANNSRNSVNTRVTVEPRLCNNCFVGYGSILEPPSSPSSPLQPKAPFQLVSSEQRHTLELESKPFPSPAASKAASFHPVPRKPSLTKLPAKKLAEFLVSVFEAEDEIPVFDDLEHNSDDHLWHNDHFEALHDARVVVLKEETLTHIFHLIRGSSELFEDFALREVHNKKDLENAHPPPRQLYDIDHAYLSRLMRILEHTTRASEGTIPVKISTSDSSVCLPGERTSDSDTYQRTDQIIQHVVTQQERFLDATDLLVRGVQAAQCIFALMSASDPPRILLSEDAVQAGLIAIKSCTDGVLVPFSDASLETSTESNNGNTRFFVSIARALPASTKASKKGHKRVSNRGPEAIRAWDCTLVLVKAFESCKTAVFSFQRLCCSGNFSLSETIIVSVFYLALKALSMSEPEGRSASSFAANRLVSLWRAVDEASGIAHGQALAKLRQPYLSLVQFLFSKYPDQRAWILEEILSNLINFPDLQSQCKLYRLSNGAMIHSINALLIQMVQHADDSVEASRASAGDVSLSQNGPTPTPPPIAIDMDELGSELLASPNGLLSSDSENPVSSERTGLEGAISASGVITSFLMSKLINLPKASKSAHDLSYIHVVDAFMVDLHMVVFLPDWPAVAMLLTRMSAGFLKLLDNATNTDIRGFAVEHLGSITALLRSAELELEQARLPPARFNASWTVDQVAFIVNGYVNTIQCLHNSYAKDNIQALGSSIQFWRARALAELNHMHQMVQDAVLDLDVTSDTKTLIEAIKGGKERLLRKKFSVELTPLSAGVSAVEVYKSAGKTVKLLTVTSPTFVAFEVMKKGLLRAMGDKSIPTRQRALRMIISVNGVDPALLDDKHVRSAVEDRLFDGSPAVRELALKLLGDFLVRAPQHIPQYLDPIMVQLSDSASSVRKRVARIITSLYAATYETSIQIKLCTRIVRDIAFDTTGLQPLALDAMGEMWFGIPSASEKGAAAPLPTAPSVHTSPTSAGLVATAPPAAPSGILPPSGNVNGSVLAKQAPVIVCVARHLRGRPSPLEEAFRAFFRRANASTRSLIYSNFQTLAEKLIDGLDTSPSLSESHQNEQDSNNFLRVIHAVVAAHPQALSAAKARRLLPYLSNAKSPDELVRMELSLRILAVSIPHTPRTSCAFNEHLQKVLTGLVNRPPPISPASPVIQELIACFCAASIYLTHDYKIMVRTLAACVMRMRTVVAKMTAPGVAKPPLSSNGEQLGLADRPNALVVAMSSLLCEHADFDRLREENHELRPLFNRMGKPPILLTVFGLLMRLYRSPLPAWQLAALQNMGLLLRAYTSLWTEGRMKDIMDHIFSGNNTRQKEYMMRVMAEFLGKEHRRQADRNDDQRGVNTAIDADGKVDMAQLIGNTESFAESSVSAQLIQRYLDPVLEAAVAVTSPSMQRFAMDILDHTVKRGLSHPLHCVVTLISVETSPNRRLADKALELHTILATKHGSIMAVRYLENVRAVFNYQRKIQPVYGKLRGHKVVATGKVESAADGNVTALMGPWYGLMPDKRQRMDFIRNLGRTIDCDTTAGAAPATSNDVLFARFVADNLAVLAYRSMDEILVVLHELKKIVSTTGMQALHIAKRDAPVDADSGRMSGNQLADHHREPSGPTMLYTPEIRVSRGLQETDTESSCTLDKSSHVAAIDGGSNLEVHGRMCQLAGLALALRNHIKWRYHLSEAKCVEPKAAGANKRKGAYAQDKAPAQRVLTDPGKVVLSLDSLRHITLETLTPDQSREVLEWYQSLVARELTEIEPEDDLDLCTLHTTTVDDALPATQHSSVTPRLEDPFTPTPSKSSPEPSPFNLPTVPAGPFNITQRARMDPV